MDLMLFWVHLFAFLSVWKLEAIIWAVIIIAVIVVAYLIKIKVADNR